MFFPTVSQARSPEAEMLAQEIAGLVRTRRMQRPDLPWGDVWAAFAIAREMLSGEFAGSAARAPVFAAVAVALLTALGAAVAFFTAQP